MAHALCEGDELAAVEAYRLIQLVVVDGASDHRGEALGCAIKVHVPAGERRVDRTYSQTAPSLSLSPRRSTSAVNRDAGTVSCGRRRLEVDDGSLNDGGSPLARPARLPATAVECDCCQDLPQPWPCSGQLQALGSRCCFLPPLRSLRLQTSYPFAISGRIAPLAACVNCACRSGWALTRCENLKRWLSRASGSKRERLYFRPGTVSRRFTRFAPDRAKRRCRTRVAESRSPDTT